LKCVCLRIWRTHTIWFRRVIRLCYCPRPLQHLCHHVFSSLSRALHKGRNSVQARFWTTDILPYASCTRGWHSNVNHSISIPSNSKGMDALPSSVTSYLIPLLGTHARTEPTPHISTIFWNTFPALILELSLTSITIIWSLRNFRWFWVLGALPSPENPASMTDAIAPYPTTKLSPEHGVIKQESISQYKKLMSVTHNNVYELTYEAPQCPKQGWIWIILQRRETTSFSTNSNTGSSVKIKNTRSRHANRSTTSTFYRKSN